MGKIYKVILSKKEFKLPQQTNDKLSKKIENQLNITIKKHESFEKFNEITEIIDTPEIVIANQKTNIFLLNLLLLTANIKGLEIQKKTYNNNTIILNLEKMTGIQLQGIPFELLEKKVESCLIKLKGKPVNQKEEVEKTSSVLDKVEYSLGWLKKAHEERKRKGDI